MTLSKTSSRRRDDVEREEKPSRRLLKFSDLKQRRICENHVRLRDLIEHQGFPRGFWTGPNTHVWWEHEVEAWLEACPTEKPPCPSRERKTRTPPTRRVAG